MGFPNVDKLLVRIFKQGFDRIKATPAFVINEHFEDLEEAERAQIITYLTRKKFITDVREKGDGRVYLLTSHPLIDIPFPQIAVTLGAGQSDRYMGDLTGEVEPIIEEGQTVGWFIEKGYYKKTSWNINVVCATKDEVIWLSSLVQRLICEAFDDLARAGITEVDIIDQDPQLEEGTLQPSTAFSRLTRLQATVANTWKERQDPIDIRPGVNNAL